MAAKSDSKVLEAVLRAIGTKHQHQWGSSDASNATELVKVRGWVVPNRIDVEYAGVDGQPTLTMTLEVIDGVPRCTDLRLQRQARGGRPVRQKDLTAIRLNDWIDAEFAGFAIETSGDGRLGQKLGGGGPAGRAQIGRSVVEFQKARRNGERPTVTRERIKEAAEIYRANFNGQPIKAVADRMGVSERTASSYITLARSSDYKFLSPTKRGKKSL